MSKEASLLPVSRRTFLTGTAAAGAALCATPALLSAAAKGANERLSLALIGVGVRGSYHLNGLKLLAERENVEITAVCDVWRVNCEKAAARVKKITGKQPRTSSRFADILAMKDVDAVVIATPDYAHGDILCAALEAGKDVYAEKPMSIELEPANKALDLARSGGRVVQAGTQRRSDKQFIAAAEIGASGVLGKISRIDAQVAFNGPRWARDYSDCKQADVDWDAFLFNRPQVPFDPKLLRRWQLCKLCSNGLPGLWMSHYSDVVNMITGAKYPTSVMALGGNYVWKECRELGDTIHVLLEYPEGFLFNWGMSLGNAATMQFTVHGTQGTLDLEKWTLSPAGGANGTKVKLQSIPPEAVPAEQAHTHMANWLQCMRTRQRPNCDIEYGHQHAVATIMAANAFVSGRRLRYDAKSRQIVPA